MIPAFEGPEKKNTRGSYMRKYGNLYWPAEHSHGQAYSKWINQTWHPVGILIHKKYILNHINNNFKTQEGFWINPGVPPNPEHESHPVNPSKLLQCTLKNKFNYVIKKFIPTMQKCIVFVAEF